MWRTINKVLDKSFVIVSLLSLEVEGKYLTHEWDAVEIMNCHFALVGPNAWFPYNFLVPATHPQLTSNIDFFNANTSF